MTRERIDNAGEARHLLKEHPLTKPKNVRVDDAVGAAPVHAVGATGMDGIEVDLDLLSRTEKELEDLYGDLYQQLQDAGALTGPLADGSSPVTGPMRTAFLERADDDAGIQATLRDYLRELLKIRGAILDTLGSYSSIDTEAVARLNDQSAALEAGVGNATGA